MNRSLPSRLLLILLAGLLQVALLPGVGRTTCMLRTASLTGCCCVERVEPQPAPATSCCNAQELRKLAGEQPKMGGQCDCDDDADQLRATRGLLADAVAAKKIADLDDASHALLPRHLAEPMLGQAAPPVALRAAPPARTGPPLHVLLQVFLI